MQRAARLEPGRRRMLLCAIAFVAAASAAVRFLPFRRAIRFGAVDANSRPTRTDVLVSEAVWAVERAAGLLPVRAKCIEKGLALQRLLRGRGVPALLHYGVGKDGEGALAAHVWVEADGAVVLGGGEMAAFRRVATYP